jgi:hypothetical protein
MRRYAKVGRDDGVDFYHGGDWFHELYDGFAIKKPTALSAQLLRELQDVVAQHHRDAVLDLGGDIDTPIFGLRVLVTPTAICAAWCENTAATCRRKLKKAGAQILR